MKKIICALTTALSIFLYSETLYENADWETIIKSNERIQGYEKLEVKNNSNVIVMTGIQIRKVRIDRIYTNMNLKMSEVIILKSDLEEAFLKKNKDIKSIDLTIKKDYLIAKGKANLMGMLMSAYLEGDFYLNDKGEITYEVTKANVNRIIPVPESILEKFSKKLNPVFKLEHLGIPMYIKEIIFEKDRIILR